MPTKGLSGGIVYAFRRSAWVDAQDLAQQRAERLPVATGHVPRALVAGRAAVAEPDVEHPVRPEAELPAVVVHLRLGLREDLASRARLDGSRGVDRVLVDSGVAALVRVVDVELRAVG